MKCVLNMISAKPNAASFIARWIKATKFMCIKVTGLKLSTITRWQKARFYLHPMYVNTFQIQRPLMMHFAP